MTSKGHNHMNIDINCKTRNYTKNFIKQILGPDTKSPHIGAIEDTGLKKLDRMSWFLFSACIQVLAIYTPTSIISKIYLRL